MGDPVRLLGQGTANADARQQLLRPRPQIVGARMRRGMRALLEEAEAHPMVRQRAGGGQADRSAADDDDVRIEPVGLRGKGHGVSR
ncbi:hypothetical protein GGR77_000209 [Xanthomonas translucens]